MVLTVPPEGVATAGAAVIHCGGAGEAGETEPPCPYVATGCTAGADTACQVPTGLGGEAIPGEATTLVGLGLEHLVGIDVVQVTAGGAAPPEQATPQTPGEPYGGLA
mmetsp:Transcript_30466/g.55596  ORF Transcript_30466/g.55596 Transcript_30466/m.55596 type:complete len:107 (+) Transcript_30466:577-897(+)